MLFFSLIKSFKNFSTKFKSPFDTTFTKKSRFIFIVGFDLKAKKILLYKFDYSNISFFAHLRFERGMVYNIYRLGEVGESPP